MKKYIIHLLTVALTVVIGVGVFGCARAPEPAAAEWDFPCIADLTGPFAGYGLEAQWATIESTNDINAAGGVAGRPIKLIWYDCANDPAKCRVEMGKILDKHPLMIGANIADAVKGCAEPAVAAKVFMILPAAGTLLTKEYDPYCVSFLNYDENLCSHAEVPWINKEPAIKSVVQILDNTVEWYVNCVKLQHEALEKAGITVLEPVTFEQMATLDFGPVAVQAISRNADGYILTCMGDSAAKVIIELQRRGVTENPRIYCHACTDHPELYEVGEGYLDDCYVASFFDATHPGERWQSLKERYKVVSDIPMGFGTWIGCDIPYYFKYCVEATGVTGDPAKWAEEQQILAEFAYNIKDFKFVMGEADVVDGVALMPMVLSQIRNNEKVLVETIPMPEVP